MPQKVFVLGFKNSWQRLEGGSRIGALRGVLAREAQISNMHTDNPHALPIFENTFLLRNTLEILWLLFKSTLTCCQTNNKSRLHSPLTEIHKESGKKILFFYVQLYIEYRLNCCHVRVSALRSTVHAAILCARTCRAQRFKSCHMMTSKVMKTRLNESGGWFSQTLPRLANIKHEKKLTVPTIVWSSESGGLSGQNFAIFIYI